MYRQIVTWKCFRSVSSDPVREHYGISSYPQGQICRELNLNCRRIPCWVREDPITIGWYRNLFHSHYRGRQGMVRMVLLDKAQAVKNSFRISELHMDCQRLLAFSQRDYLREVRGACVQQHHQISRAAKDFRQRRFLFPSCLTVFRGGRLSFQFTGGATTTAHGLYSQMRKYSKYFELIFQFVSFRNLIVNKEAKKERVMKKLQGLTQTEINKRQRDSSH